MSFLLLKIFFLMLLAALFGAWLAHWWFKRHYEDVTLTHHLMGQGTSYEGPDLAPMEQKIANLEQSITALKIPETDLNPVQQRLDTMEASIRGLTFPETDFAPMEARLFSMENMLSTPPNTSDDLDGFDTRLTSIEETLTSLNTKAAGMRNTDTSRIERQMDVIASAIAERTDTDLAPIETRLAELETAITSITLPETDLSAIESRIHAMHESITEHRSLDLNEKDELHKRMINLSTAVGTLRNTDFTPLDQRLDDIETRIAHIHVPAPDLTSLDEGLSAIHGRISGLDDSVNTVYGRMNGIDEGINTIHGRMSSVDEGLNMVHGRMAGLDTRLDEDRTYQHGEATLTQQRIDQLQSTLARLDHMDSKLAALRADMSEARPNLDPLEQRVISLQNDLANRPETDLNPVLSSVYAMEQRMDFGAMENRLTSIEYGLAALHHMLRSRQTLTQPPTPTSSPEAPQYSARPQRRETPPPPPPTYTRAPYQEREYYPTPPPAPQSQWAEQMPMPRPFDVPDMPNTSGYEYDTAPMPEPAPPRDPVGNARRPDDKANLLMRPAFGTPDDLEEISGVGPMLHGLLTEIGVFYFWQIAEWGPREIEWVDDMLDGFNGRIERDDWVKQAKALAAGKSAAKRP